MRTKGGLEVSGNGIHQSANPADGEVIFGEIICVGPGFRLQSGDIVEPQYKVGHVVGFEIAQCFKCDLMGPGYWLMAESAIYFSIDPAVDACTVADLYGLNQPELETAQ